MTPDSLERAREAARVALSAFAKKNDYCDIGSEDADLLSTVAIDTFLTELSKAHVVVHGEKLLRLLGNLHARIQDLESPEASTPDVVPWIRGRMSAKADLKELIEAAPSS